MPENQNSLRDALILAGIEEINKHGVSGFSIRRVAMACNVSCAAPYRHFQDREALILAIIDYVNDIWAQRQKQILSQCGDTVREQLTEISVNFVRFLMEKPFYRAVLMLNSGEFKNMYHKKQSAFGSLSQTLQAKLHEETNMSEDVWMRKLMLVRSMIFGVVLLFDSGEFEYNETSMAHIRYIIEREFEID